MRTLHIQNRVSQRDSARPALRSALNNVAQQPDLSQDAHADVQVNPLPQSLAEYREAIASLVDEFELRVSSENTYDLIAAASTLADEQELYGHLVRDILSEKLPLTPEEPDEDPTDEPLEQINTPRKLVRWLGKRMVNQATKLQNKQQQLNQEVLQDAEILKQDVLEAQELIQQVILMTLHDAKMVDLRDLSVHLPSSGFSIQGCYGYYNDPLHCDVTDPAFVGNTATFGDMVASIVEHYGSVANFIKNVERPYMEEVAKRVSGYSDAQWQTLKNADPNAALDLVNAFMQVAAPIVPQEPLDFLIVAKPLKQGAELTLATGIILSKRSEVLLKSLVKKYAAKGDAKSQQIVQRAKNLLKRNEARVAKLEEICRIPSLCKADRALVLKLKQFLPQSFLEKLAKENALADAGKIIKPGAGANLNQYNTMLKKAEYFKVDPNKAGATDKAKEWVLKELQDFKDKGVQRNAKTSFPDLTPYELARANLGQIKGNRGSDFDQARAKVAQELFENGYISKKTSSAVKEMESKLGLTWHHNEDLKTMQLVPRGIHEPIKHMGGVVIMTELNNGRLARSAYNTFISGNY